MFVETTQENLCVRIIKKIGASGYYYNSKNSAVRKENGFPCVFPIDH